ncbi:SSI family serine proteinase inhibitor [Kutzneria kofuensis]|uniref:SSI family serine proteinase inhibitor n=1 Tax=Kutzneria kofuensis TaxID=103725 RepID=UPI0031EABDE3
MPRHHRRGGRLRPVARRRGEGVCGAGSDLYDPVTVSATGVWDGVTVDYRKTFPNQCKLRLRTGSVFDL